MKVRIHTTNSMSNATYHKRCFKPGQKYWWLKSSDEEFMPIGGHRGDRTLDVEVDLEPGEYVLGCGPPKHGRRIPVTIHEDGTVEVKD